MCVYVRTRASRAPAYSLEQAWRGSEKGSWLEGPTSAQGADGGMGLFGLEWRAPTCFLLVWCIPKFRRLAADPPGRAGGRSPLGTQQSFGSPCTGAGAAAVGRLREAEQPWGEHTGLCWLLGLQMVALPRAAVRRDTHTLALALFLPGNLLLAAILG